MILLHLSLKWLTIQKILDLWIVGNVLMQMVLCATMTPIKVKFKLRDLLIEHMVFAANQDLLGNIAIMMVNTPVVSLQTDQEMGLVIFLLTEKTIKCLHSVLAQEIKKLAELAMMIKILT
jgi:hypothetical protein